MDAPSSRRRSHWIAAAAVVFLLAGFAVLVSQWRTPPRAPAMGTVGGDGGDSSDAVIGQALGQIPVDSTAIKNRWMDDVRGIDVSALSAGQHEIFVRFANAERCTCGCGYTLAACRTYDQTCPISGGILESLRDSVAAGHVRSVRGLRERPGAG